MDGLLGKESADFIHTQVNVQPVQAACGCMLDLLADLVKQSEEKNEE